MTSIEPNTATFRMMRDGNNALGLTREGIDITGGKIIYWINGIEYRDAELTLKWLPGVASEVKKYPSN